MVMNNDGSGNILQTNSLLPPHEWTDEFRKKLADALGIKKEEIRNHTTLEFFNIIVTNPPFGSKIPIKDKNILEQFELAHIWENDKKTNTWTMTNRLQTSVPPEILFIERCTQFLVPGGRMGIVFPDTEATHYCKYRSSCRYISAKKWNSNIGSFSPKENAGAEECRRKKR